ncbi:MAG: hypothetical protein WBM17_09470 [Anaerolineales bacterium]
MPTQERISRRGIVGLLLLWAAMLLAANLVSIFLHEDGHGIGARIDGIHVSTGFNKVGAAGKSPQDPDFRTGMPDGFWAGLFGPFTTWILAIGFTLWLLLRRTVSAGTMAVGAAAVANGLIRAFPMVFFLISALAGKLHFEDEVHWSLWYALKFCHPELAALDTATLQKTYSALFLSEPVFWAPPLVSLGISLACLVPAYWKLNRLWKDKLRPGWVLVFGLTPLAMYFVAMPILNALDKIIRIDW